MAFETKPMRLGEWVAFQKAFTMRFMAAAAPSTMALFLYSEPGQPDATLGVAGLSRLDVETLSPGGWTTVQRLDGPDWNLLVGNASAPGKLGVALIEDEDCPTPSSSLTSPWAPSRSRW